MAEACGDDRELRQQVELYLAEAEGAEDFMETPAVSLRAGAGDDPAGSRPDGQGAEPAPGEPGEGHRIGPYRIERLLGRGGMGAVYLAARVDEFEMRQVALKLLKRGLNTAELVGRFHHERQTLGHLDHPNIAKLLDGGTTEDGIPYFVMDYVEGRPIDSYCDQQDLGIDERLELFRKVCSAVHVAHQNLVVHRDLKPANILVGADGEPKLLDFGIAKPLDVDDAGPQPMTLAYASPEQLDDQAITTASDVYSLGVVLYELLTRRSPYRTASLGPLELAQAIRRQRPEKPSTAVELTVADLRPGDDSETQTPNALRRRRAATLRGDRCRLAGDLDSIVLTALAKDPGDRFASVEQLSADIGRHLEGLPVTTRKLTFAYWAGKFIRRHTRETALAALVLATILGFSAYTLHLKNEAVRLKDQAVSDRQRAVQVSDFLVRLFQAPSPDKAKGKEITAREILDRGKAQINEYRGSQPRLYARLAFTMGEVYFRLGRYPDAQALLEDALGDLQKHLDGTDDPLLASLTNDLAAVLWAQGFPAQAETRFRESLAMKTRLFGEESMQVIDTLNNLATLARIRGDLAEARSIYIRVLAKLERLSPPVPEQLARNRLLLGTLLLDLGTFDAAETHLRQALAMRRQLYGADDTRVAVVLNNLGIALQARGKTEDSERFYRRTLEIRRTLLGERHPRVAATEAHLASLLVVMEQYEEAEALARKALETLHTSTPDHWRIAHAQSVLGEALAATGRFPEAEPLLLEGYRTLAETKGECDRYIIDAARRLVEFHDASGQTDRAMEYRAELTQCDAGARSPAPAAN